MGSSGRRLGGWRLAAGCAWACSLLAGPLALAAEDPLPASPPPCEARPYPNGYTTATGSPYCVSRNVDPSLVVPPEGWNPHVGSFTQVTAFFPSSPAPGGLPVPFDYPRVVLTHHDPGSVQPRYPRWSEISTGRNLNDPAAMYIELVPVHDCAPTDSTCEFEVRPCFHALCAGTGYPGDPPAWYEVVIPEYVAGNTGGQDIFLFSTVGAAIGLVGDGNRAPSILLSLSQPDSDDALVVRAQVAATDPDDDPITRYVYDWGDGAQTETNVPSADHTYAAPGTYRVNVYVSDQRSAWSSTSRNINAGHRIEPKVTGPHEVPIGGELQIHVTVTNRGSAAIDLGHNYGYEGGAPPAGTIALGDHPSFTRVRLEPGESIDGTYVFDALKAAVVPFIFGGSGKPSGCAPCSSMSEYVLHEVVIGGASKPDAVIDGKGDGVHNTNGIFQKAKIDLRAGKQRTVVLDVQNDGQATSDFVLDGSASGGPFVVRYFEGKTQITDEVTAGTYTLEDVAPGEKRRLKVKVKAGTAPGKVKMLRVETTSTGSQAKDVVKARVQVLP